MFYLLTRRKSQGTTLLRVGLSQSNIDKMVHSSEAKLLDKDFCSDWESKQNLLFFDQNYEINQLENIF